MKGIFRKVDRFGRISIPATLRETYGIDIGDNIVIKPMEGGFYVRKESKRARCLVTGKETDDIKIYGDGLFLSEEGKLKLLEVLRSEIDR